jgi:hypothetical protein
LPPPVRHFVELGYGADVTDASPSGERVIILTAGTRPYPVVFEMYADTVVLQPGESLRLVLIGPPSAKLEIGQGDEGCSVFRDEDLHVDVFDSSGTKLKISGW